MKSRFNVALEIKTLGARQFEGHGSIFGNVDLGGDVVIKGAFEESLAEHEEAGMMPQMFWMHQMDKVPGKWLSMEEDKKGLAVVGELAETELGNEMHTLLNMKAVRGLSIGYQTEDYSYDKMGNRLLKKVNLWEVSLVSLAMNPLAQVEASKSRLSKSGEYVPVGYEFKRDLEHHLRDVGLSSSIAKTLVAKLFIGEDINAMLFDPQQREAVKSEDMDDALMQEILGSATKSAAGLYLSSTKAFDLNAE